MDSILDRPWAVVLAVFVLAAIAGSTGQSAATGSFERTLPVSGPVELEVTSGSGSIEVRAGNEGSVWVRGVVRARGGWLGGARDAEKQVRRLEASPPIEQQGGVIRVGRFGRWESSRNVSISYEIVAPAGTRLRSQASSGSQVIDGLAGPVDVTTGSGSVDVSNIGDAVTAVAASGGIKIDAARGPVRATTGSGGIRATGIGGGFTATTGSGGIHLEQVGAGDVVVSSGSGYVNLAGVRGSLRAHTASGSIRAEGQLAGDWSLHAGSGGITVRLPPQAGFELRAQTGSGHITVNHPLTARGAVGRREVAGRVRDGGPRLDLTTASGSIRVD